MTIPSNAPTQPPPYAVGRPSAPGFSPRSPSRLDPNAGAAVAPQPGATERGDPARSRPAALGRPGDLAAAARAILVVRPGHAPRRVEPAGEAPRHLGDVPLVPRRQRPQQLG